jgi:hypothetical protein
MYSGSQRDLVDTIKWPQWRERYLDGRGSETGWMIGWHGIEEIRERTHVHPRNATMSGGTHTLSLEADVAATFRVAAEGVRARSSLLFEGAHHELCR